MTDNVINLWQSTHARNAQLRENEVRRSVNAADQSAVFLHAFPHLIKHGGVFAMLNAMGDVGAFVFRDTSFHASSIIVNAVLRRGRLREGVVFLPQVYDYDDVKKEWLFTAYNDACVLSDGSKIEAGKLAVKSLIFLWENTLYRRFEIINQSDVFLDLTIDIAFDNSSVDIFDLRGDPQRVWGRYWPAIHDNSSLQAIYEASDHICHCTYLNFEPEPERLDTRSAHFKVHLRGGDSSTVVMKVKVDQSLPEQALPLPVPSPQKGMLEFARQRLEIELEQAKKNRASLISHNPVLNRVLERATSDLAMLTTGTENGPFIMAGLPWFNAVFGRDSLVTALLDLWRNPELARGILFYLAANQAHDFDIGSAAQPGKIPHEIRLCEMARTGQVPYRRYYGSVDAPMLFIMLADAYHQRTNDDVTIRQLWPSILSVLQWMRTLGDLDQTGIIKYARATHSDLANQGWEDSGDSVYHGNGNLASGAIGLVEVQGYAYAARKGAVRLAHALGFSDECKAMELEMLRSHALIESGFWDVRMQAYGMAVDERGLCQTLDSNMGQLLFTEAIPQERAEFVADLLLSPAFFSGWGIRTKSIKAARYDPLSYHNGSIWPHANALIGLGLIKYRRHEEASKILTSLIHAASYFSDRCPELFSGATRQAGVPPDTYKNANPIQAWAAAAIPGLTFGFLSARIDAKTRTVFFERPYLPECFGGHLEVLRLQVGSGELDLVFEGTGFNTTFRITRVEGGARVQLAPWGGSA